MSNAEFCMKLLDCIFFVELIAITFVPAVTASMCSSPSASV